MKKLLMGAIVLSCFAIAMSIFQMSCQKDATAQTGTNYTLPPATTSILGGVIVGNGLSVTSSGVLSIASGGSTIQVNKVIFRKVLFSSGGLPLGEEIWVCNYDGTGAAKVNITLPTGISYSDEMTPAMSPNGQKIFFCAGAVDGSGSILIKGSLYVCNSDGTGVTKIVDRGNNGHITLGGAY